MPKSPEPRAKSAKPPKRPGMVDWYSVSQLAATGAQTLISTILGSNIDSRRLLAAAGELEESVFDYSEPRPDEPPRPAARRAPFSIAYTADTGDGWASTYTTAYLLTAPDLPVAGEPEPLPAAEVVVLGGDEVYPVASTRAYRSRLLDPFAAAARDVRRDRDLGSLPVRDLYMIPGNHDWYDSLGSMSRRFFSYRHPGSQNDFGGDRKPRRLGQFKTHQPRSYFVLKLPRDWEVWGVDIQLGEDIDTEQRAFFAWHAQSIGRRTKVLLCCAAPTISYAKNHEDDDETLTFELKRIRNLAWNRGARTYAQIAGDIHNYQRYIEEKETRDKQPYERHHIGCGGGGAFLHPTHSFYRGPGRVEPACRYPRLSQSRRLSWRIPLFAGRHPGMCLLFGLLYLAILWRAPWRSPAELARHLVDHPLGALVALAVVGGCALFAGTGKRLWGLAHGLGHLALAVAAWAVGGWVGGLIPQPTLAALGERVAVVGAGALFGGTFFGLYLWASLNWQRIHHNEAFSTLGWPHHKSLVRFTVEEDGGLTVRVLGVERTADDRAEHPVQVHLVEKFGIPGGSGPAAGGASAEEE